MSEQLTGNAGSTPEKPKDQQYEVFKAAQDEETRIRQEIEKVLAANPDRQAAEKIVLETLADQMDEAIKKTRQALEVWMQSIK